MIRAAKNLHSRYGTLFCACLIFWCASLAVCLGAEIFAPCAYDVQDMALGASAPSKAHLLGTDIMGRDLLSRILYGGRISFFVGILATLTATVIGTAYGMVSGLFGGLADSVMMRIVDVIYSLPFTIFVIILTLVFGRSIGVIFVAIGAVEWLTMARIARAATLDLRSRQFVEAAVACGQGKIGIMTRHILPNLSRSMVVCAALTMPSVMLLETFLSFLGLGVQAPLPSLGGLLKDGAEFMEDAPWLLVFPALFFSAILYSANFIGETLSRQKK